MDSSIDRKGRTRKHTHTLLRRLPAGVVAVGPAEGGSGAARGAGAGALPSEVDVEDVETPDGLGGATQVRATAPGSGLATAELVVVGEGEGGGWARVDAGEGGGGLIRVTGGVAARGDVRRKGSWAVVEAGEEGVCKERIDARPEGDATGLAADEEKRLTGTPPGVVGPLRPAEGSRIPFTVQIYAVASYDRARSASSSVLCEKPDHNAWKREQQVAQEKNLTNTET